MSKEKRTYRERSEYLKTAVTKRRQRLKEECVAIKGGKCVVCGYNRCVACLEFHHIGKEKEFGVSFRGFSYSKRRMVEEVQKCVLLCANCHRELHNGLLQLPDENQECKPGELREA